MTQPYTVDISTEGTGVNSSHTDRSPAAVSSHLTARNSSRRSLLAGITAAGSVGLLALLAPSECFASGLSSGASKETKVTPLTTMALPDFPGKEVLILTVEYPPGSSDPIHKHDAHSFIYVLEGAIVMGVKGGEPVRLHPGQTFYEGPHDIHTIGRNASTTKSAKFLVFLIKNQNAPAVIPLN